jgi:V8-like Glu-specific endopeptidase
VPFGQEVVPAGPVLIPPEGDDRPVRSPGAPGAAAWRGKFFETLSATSPTPPESAADPDAALLDAWHGSFTAPAAAAAARETLLKLREQGFRVLLPGVDDHRIPGPGDGSPPWHGVCFLTVTAARGTRWVGTGWLAGPRTVVTAGHCVYLHEHGGWAKRVEVRLPGLDRPVVATDFRSVGGWVENRDARADYGAVVLPEPVPGPYREAVAADPGERPPVVVFGYCSDHPDTLSAQERTVREVRDRQLVYEFPVLGGTSGGPVLPLIGDDPGVIGIQQHGDFVGGAAVRISPAVRANIEAWVREAG